MTKYNIIGIDLAKTKLHLVALDLERKVAFKEAIYKEDFLKKVETMFTKDNKFAFEACAGCHYMAQQLQGRGYEVVLLKAKDVKGYAKARQKNDSNDALAICKAANDPEVKQVHAKSKEEQEVAYLHKARQNTIKQRIQRCNSLKGSLMEFGYTVQCSKSIFISILKIILQEAYDNKLITQVIHKHMLEDGEEIEALCIREKELDKAIVEMNKQSKAAKIVESIPGIGPINASILSIKPVGLYSSAKDFAASLGLVPKQTPQVETFVWGQLQSKEIVMLGRC